MTWSTRSPASRTAMPMVLMYHSIAVSPQDPYRLAVHPRRFAQQLGWLRRRGLRGVSMRELLRARDDGEDRRLIGLTFDDGYADFVTGAVPLLRAYGWTATVFVIAGRLGGANDWDVAGPVKPLMTAGEVRRAAADGMEIGSHGLSHTSLPALPPGALAGEVARSKAVLEDVTGAEVTGFCYPYGHVCGVVADVVAAAGYRYGCTVAATGTTDRYAIPRTYIGDRDHAARLRAKWLRHRLRRP